MRLPLRVRVTLASAASIALILGALSFFCVHPAQAQLLRTADAGLRARAEAIASVTGRLGEAGFDAPDAVAGEFTPGADACRAAGDGQQSRAAQLSAGLAAAIPRPVRRPPGGPGRQACGRSCYRWPRDDGSTCDRSALDQASTTLAGLPPRLAASSGPGAAWLPRRSRPGPELPAGSDTEIAAGPPGACRSPAGGAGSGEQPGPPDEGQA